MRPREKRPACCDAAGSAYDEGAIEWRDADPGGDALAGLPGHGPPHADPKTPAEVNANRFWTTARVGQGYYQRPTPASYRVVVDWCPETEGGSYPIWGDASYCSFCGEAWTVAGQEKRDVEIMSRLAKDHEFLHGQAVKAHAARDALVAGLRALVKCLRDEKGKDASNQFAGAPLGCECGAVRDPSGRYYGRPDHPCPGCRMRDAALEACAALVEEALA